MNSMERVLMAMKGGKIDRRPVTLILSLYGARLTSCPLKEYYTNPRAYLEGQLAVIEQCRPDIVFTPFVLTAEGEAFGSEVVYIDRNPPNLKKPAITQAGSISALPEPDIDSHPRLLYIREATRLLAAGCQGKRPVAATLLSPMDLPSLIMGIEGWLDTILFDPENTRLMLDKTVKYFIEWGNTLLADGATFLVIPSVFTNPNILTRKMVKEIVIPVLAEAFQEIKGPLVFHHGSNPIAKFMEIYSSLPNVAGFFLDNRDSFAEARKTIGQGKVLFGNIDGPNLWRLKPETIRTECRKLLEERKDDDHFIIATSATDVAFDTPVENIVAMVETVEEFG